LLRKVEMVEGLAKSATLRDIAVTGQYVGKSDVQQWIAWRKGEGFHPQTQ